MAFKTVCKQDCPDRSWDCHAKCDAYKKEREEHEKRYKQKAMYESSMVDTFASLKTVTDGLGRIKYCRRCRRRNK